MTPGERGRRHRTRLAAVLLALVVLAGLAAGCSSAVRVAPLPQSDSPICQEAAQAWPATVSGLERRTTAVQSQGVAAWGDPPVIARCGGEPPAPTEDPCLGVDDIDWLALSLEDGTRFVTYGRTPTIEVIVPDDYGSSSLLLSVFADAASATAETGRTCS